MKHFEAEDWIDFARKLGNEDKRQAMQKHVSAGCKSCLTNLRFWEGIAQSAGRESSYEPPSGVVRIVKAMGAPQPSRASASPLRVLAQLVMDSALEPATAGMRSGTPSRRLLVYKAGNVNIDLCVVRIPASSRVSVVGQVMDLSTPAHAIAGARVAAVLGKNEERDATNTNEFGEFQLEFEPSGKVGLSVKVDATEIRLPLDRPNAGETGGSSY